VLLFFLFPLRPGTPAVLCKIQKSFSPWLPGRVGTAPCISQRMHAARVLAPDAIAPPKREQNVATEITVVRSARRPGVSARAFS
jgi:hypothetical protein